MGDLELAMFAAWWRRLSHLSILLLFSLGANLFVAGWLLGGNFIRPRQGVPINQYGEQIKAALSADGALVMQNTFENIHRRFAARSAAARSTRDRLASVLTTEPFSVAEYIAASREALKEREDDRNLADEEVAAAIARLSPEDRRRLAELRSRRRPGGAAPGFLP
jgi:uncharacterized membrane protein